MRLGTANTDFARRGDPKYLDFLTEHADVLGLQEAKDVVVRDHLPHGWRDFQPGALMGDKARMGSPIAWDDSKYRVEESYQTIGCQPFWMGQRLGLLPRWITVVRLTNRKTGNQRAVISAHLPPRRFRVLAPGYKKNLKKVTDRYRHWTVCTDANEPITRLAIYLGGRAYPKTGIVGFVSSEAMVDIEVRHWGQGQDFTDHPAVTGQST
jgi:hypothetical protein